MDAIKIPSYDRWCFGTHQSYCCRGRPPEAPIYLCPENSGFEASKIENLCPEIADLRPEKSDLCPGHSGF